MTPDQKSNYLHAMRKARLARRQAEKRSEAAAILSAVAILALCIAASVTGVEL